MVHASIGVSPQPDAGLPSRRKAEANASAGAWFGEPDLAAVRLDDRAGNRQSESGAAARPGGVGAGAVKRLEHALALFRRDPVARVGDLNLDPVGDRLGRITTLPSAGV